jgi:hypothetical protein
VRSVAERRVSNHEVAEVSDVLTKFETTLHQNTHMGHVLRDGRLRRPPQDEAIAS